MDLTPDHHIDTVLQHFAEEEKIKGAVVPPIFQSSLFVFDSYEAIEEVLNIRMQGEPHVYSRVSNPSLDIVERKIAHLEKCEWAKVYGSGMGAMSCAIMGCVKSGFHAIAIDSSYSVTKLMLDKYLTRFGVTTTYVDGRDADEMIDAIRPETAFIYLESPSTYVFRLQDIRKITKAAREKGVTTVFDNSYSTPLYQNPAEMGVDLVIHSATKYLAGHSDLTAGVLCGRADRMEELIRYETSIFGSSLSPFGAWLLHRGMRTLGLRLKRHEESGNAVAAWLEGSPFVEEVFHVGLPSFPQRELYLQQMRGSAGLLSFMPKNKSKEYVTRFMNALRLFQIGVSWGGFESLCMTLPLKPSGFEEERYVVRLYCGLEDVRDMIADLDKAFRVAEGEQL